MAILVTGLGGGASYFLFNRPAPEETPTVTPMPVAPAAASVPSSSTSETSPKVSSDAPEAMSEKLAAPAQALRTATVPAVDKAPSTSAGVSRSAVAPPLSKAPTASPVAASATKVEPAEAPREVEPLTQAVDPNKIAAALKLGDFFHERGEYDNAIAE